jgi:hypothetical protein
MKDPKTITPPWNTWHCPFFSEQYLCEDCPLSPLLEEGDDETETCYPHWSHEVLHPGDIDFNMAHTARQLCTADGKRPFFHYTRNPNPPKEKGD